MHFTPTSRSWLNIIERFLCDLTVKRIRHGLFTSVEELQDAIFRYIDHHNDNPRPSSGLPKQTRSSEKSVAPASLSITQEVVEALH
jgi:hypothetical protein